MCNASKNIEKIIDIENGCRKNLTKLNINLLWQKMMNC